MKLQPIRSYATPKLPTRDVVDEHPELLRLLPKRWQSNAVVVAALTTCLALANGRAYANGTATTSVAPIFEHGRGGGTYGCKAINPPVFLSEDEAQNVIVEEAKRAGIDFSKDGKTISKVTMPTNTKLNRLSETPNGSSGRKAKTHTQVLPSIAMDGFDGKHNIAFEFVSDQDLRAWKTGVNEFGTVGDEDLIGTARALVTGIRKAKPGGVYAVFYDPSIGRGDASKRAGPAHGSDWEAEYARVTAVAEDMAREQLRAQVKDFIKWLKAQGVI